MLHTFVAYTNLFFVPRPDLKKEGKDVKDIAEEVFLLWGFGEDRFVGTVPKGLSRDILHTHERPPVGHVSLQFLTTTTPFL